jgi:peptide/nickel transport system substrate-binding protein
MLRRTLAALGLLLLAAPCWAQTLTIGSAAAPTGLDPHYHATNLNNGLLRHVFEPLLDADNRQRLQPRLAESWRLVDELTWEFRLREGVRFHDGTPFEAEDIAFTLARVPLVPNSPGPFTPRVRTVREVRILDARTVQVVTREPTPMLDRDLAEILMLSRRVHATAQLADFNSGRAMVGTGPYRFTAHAPGERIEFAGNPAHWAGRPAWERVTLRFIPQGSARVAALLAGEVDLVDQVPVQDAARLAGEARVALFATDSLAVTYLFPDSARDAVPFVTDRQGNPLGRNPLRDLRVRQAISLAIPREAIAERLLAGQGSPANQFAAPAVPDRARDLPPLATDYGRARDLLREAGFPEGFRIALHGTGGFFPADAEILQAIAQGLARAGIEARVEVLPAAPFFTRATNREFPLFFTTFTNASAANLLRQVVMTRDGATGVGPFNRQHYSSPAVDIPLAEALRTMDEERRNALTAQAMRAAMDDLAVIPVHHPRNIWAAQRGRVRYDPSPLWYTNALLAHPAD